LIFDVRYQLETTNPRAPVIDERSDAEKQAKNTTPKVVGTLRSWHQDEKGRLPDNMWPRKYKEELSAKAETKEAQDALAAEAQALQHSPQGARNLHLHYKDTSQSGSGSSVDKGPTPRSPFGLAEYTGTGTNSVHNLKIVLDYVRRRVYLTPSHYVFWALIPRQGGKYEFWQAKGQNYEESQSELADYEQASGNTGGIMMSPWIEILLQ
jgi:hypothetical protein